MSRAAVATLRRGNQVMHIYEESLALRLWSRPDADEPPCASAVRTDTLLQQAQSAARSAHEMLLRRWPDLTGAASTSLSTALRVKRVRALLSDEDVRGLSLAKRLGYVASAAAAGRHLTTCAIDEALAALQLALNEPPGQPKDYKPEKQLHLQQEQHCSPTGDMANAHIDTASATDEADTSTTASACISPRSRRRGCDLPRSPTQQPAGLDEFLWYIHKALVAQPGPVLVDQLRDTYLRHWGHHCFFERFLVVGEDGLIGTLKRIPHIVSISTAPSGAFRVEASQPAEVSKLDFAAADAAYRQMLRVK